jgi:hypothetical protein
MAKSTKTEKSMLKEFENRLLRRISGADSDRNSNRGMAKSTKTEASQFSIFT